MAVQDLSRITIATKAQTALGTAATGAGATGLEVRPSQGLQMQVAEIRSELLNKQKMQRRSRQGSRSIQGAYESELMVGAMDPIIEAVLGGTWTAAFTKTNTQLTDVTISGGGTTVTFGGGDPVTEGLRVGQMARFSDLSVVANNGVWFPIVEISGTSNRVLTVPTGYLEDNALDATFSIEIARHVHTAATFTERYFTIEEYLDTLDRSKVGTDCKWHQWSVQQQPNQMAQVSIAAGGRDLELKATVDSPHFTDPVFGGNDSVIMLDGSLYVNKVARLDLTGLTFGLEAPISFVDMISTRTSPDVFSGHAAFAGQFTGTVEDGDDFQAFLDDDRIELFTRFQERNDPTAFITMYMGNLGYGGYTDAAGGEGAQIKTVPLLGGMDRRGGAYAEATMLVSTSAT